MIRVIRLMTRFGLGCTLLRIILHGCKERLDILHRVDRVSNLSHIVLDLLQCNIKCSMVCFSKHQSHWFDSVLPHLWRISLVKKFHNSILY